MDSNLPFDVVCCLVFLARARFMSFHDVLVTQQDFIDSMLEARRVSEDIAENQNLEYVYDYEVISEGVRRTRHG